LKAPEETEKRLQHKMRGIDEVNVLAPQGNRIKHG
jgi:hypothetical protein